MEGQKAVAGCKLAPTVPKGTLVTDVQQKKWTIGKPIGSGAFGAIYLARRGKGEASDEYVVKVEPHSNGPLWCEMHALLRFGLESQRVNWKPKNGKPQGWVGIPCLEGFGSFLLEEEKLRFVVMSRFGSDIEKFFQSGRKPIPLTTALNIGIQILESLEYVHGHNYTHNDIKAQNILLGYGQDQNTVYLVDFGLACKYRDNHGFHRDSEPDERKAHEGTLEYTSRDAHNGSHSRRGDLETLGYNLVHWVTGYLPWTGDQEPEFVQSRKISFMFNVPGFLDKCFKPNQHPKVLEDYLGYTNSLEFDETPNYTKLRKLLAQAMTKEGVEPYSKLVFGTKVRSERVDDSEDEESGHEAEETRNTRSQDSDERFAPFSWEQVLGQDPESIIRQASRSSDATDNEDPLKTAAFEQLQVESLANPTPEMRKLLTAKEQLEQARQQLSWKNQLAEYNNRNAALKAKFASMDLTPCEFTPAMEEVMARRSERQALGLHSPMTPEPSDDEEIEELRTVLRANKPRSRRNKSESSQSGSTTPRTTRQSSATPRSRTNSPGHSRPGSSLSDRRPGSSTPRSRASTPVFSDRVTRSSTSSPVNNLSTSTEATGGARPRTTRSTCKKPEGRQTRSQGPPDVAASGASNGEFKLPTLNHTQVTCDECGKKMMKGSLARHMKNKHGKDEIERDEVVGGKREPASPHTPVILRKVGRVANSAATQHNTPLPNQEQEITRRPTPSTPVNANIPEAAAADEEASGLDPASLMEDCPLCFVRMPRFKIADHYDSIHSPARKLTRGLKLPSPGLPVHVSSESPLKIRNMGSPEKQVSDEEKENQPSISAAEAVKMRRGLQF